MYRPMRMQKRILLVMKNSIPRELTKSKFLKREVCLSSEVVEKMKEESEIAFKELC